MDETSDVTGEAVEVSNTVDETRFYLPSQRNFPVVDLIRRSKSYIELFQITVSKAHPINLPKLQVIMRAVRVCWDISDVRLIFVVPKEHAATYPLQNWRDKRGRVVNKGESTFTVKGRYTVTQWVLGI